MQERQNFLSIWLHYSGRRKVGVYEDNQEIHYRQINPHSKCVEFFVDSKVTYQDIIRAGLRHNIDWVLFCLSQEDRR